MLALAAEAVRAGGLSTFDIEMGDLALFDALVDALDIPSGWRSRLYEIKVGAEATRALIRDVQFHKVTDTPEHVDFQRLAPGERIRVAVAVVFHNELTSVGLKRGGVLNVVRHEVEFHCPATAIPEYITLDLDGTDIGDSLHISAVKLPEGVTPVISDRDFTIATIAGSSAMKPEPEEGVEAAEEEAEAEEEKGEEE